MYPDPCYNMIAKVQSNEAGGYVKLITGSRFRIL